MQARLHGQAEVCLSAEAEEAAKQEIRDAVSTAVSVSRGYGVSFH